MKRLQTSRRVPGRNALRVLFWWEFIRGLVLVFFKSAYRIRMRGQEHVPPTGPVIYASNHQSHMDPCIVGVLVTDRPFSGIARSTLFTNPILSWAMRGIGAIEIERGKPDTAAMKAALAELEQGRCVLIFPEGTRTRDGALGEFQRGVTLLIKKSGAVVVPVAMEGAYDIWAYGTKKPKLAGRLAVRCGPPIPAAELLRDGPDAGLERLKREIERMRMELRAELRRASGGRHPAPGPGDAPYWERVG